MCIRRSLIPCQVYHLFLHLSFVQETLSVSSVTKEMMKFIADAYDPLSHVMFTPRLIMNVLNAKKKYHDD